MNTSPDDRHRLLRMEKILAGLLRYGALVASGWIAIGMALDVFHRIFPLIRSFITISDRCLAIGIVLLIALPVLRVALMTAVFLSREITASRRSRVLCLSSSRWDSFWEPSVRVSSCYKSKPIYSYLILCFDAGPMIDCILRFTVGGFC